MSYCGAVPREMVHVGPNIAYKYLLAQIYCFNIAELVSYLQLILHCERALCMRYYDL